ncbi:hypothetical protein BDV98DRAFT_372483 [Pterulicium gracile]|uniref:Uncharacterized protein n=1 Tax=Pterulicium gracile TaxID=1884261 RepID=A0A5C3Q5S7_9AGAR|nr:hypothetical protein BDV98DRAFT_372483 [Pterula gracilis]
MAVMRFPYSIGCLLCALLAILALPAAAQRTGDEPKRDQNNLFRWEFDDNFRSTNIPACETRSMLAQSRDHAPNERGSGPYYLLAIPPGGRPRRYEVGQDPDNLRWTPDFPIDTKVILSLVDRNGGAGGVGGLLEENDGLYTISTSTNTSCIQEEPAFPPSFKASSIVQNPLYVCGEFPIEVVGGVPPYTFTLLQPTSPKITNFTNTIRTDDAFLYVNRATTGLLLAVAVSDAQRFAFGTPFVMVAGSTSPESCEIGSKPTSIAALEEKRRHEDEQRRQQVEDGQRRQQAEDEQSRSKKKQVAVAVGVTALLVPMCLAALYWYLRRRWLLFATLTGRTAGDPVLASEVGEGSGLPAQEWMPSTVPLSIVASRTLHRVTPFQAREPTDNSLASTRRTHRLFTLLTISEAARAKAEESALARQQNSQQQRVGPVASGSGEVGEVAQPPGRDARQPSIVIQHEDGGAVIRELPPPYADRSERPPQDQDIDVLVGSTSTATSALAPIEFVDQVQPPASPFYSVLDHEPTLSSPQQGPGLGKM